MARFHPISQLTGRILLFPLALVLFEFATYIAHDMIQPGMLIVTSDFSVGENWEAAIIRSGNHAIPINAHGKTEL